MPSKPVTGSFGFGAPRNTPAEIADKLNKEINAGLADPKIKARLADLGGDVLALSPTGFGGCDAAQMSVSWFCLVISASESRCPQALGRNLIEAQAALGVAGVAACKGLPAADRDVDKPRLDFQRTGMLDTFCGSGTTILAAERVGRDGSASARSARRPSSRRPRRQIAPRAAAGRLMRSQGSGHGRKPANQEQNATGRPRQPTMLP
jgi:hypothetical protein